MLLPHSPLSLRSQKFCGEWQGRIHHRQANVKCRISSSLSVLLFPQWWCWSHIRLRRHRQCSIPSKKHLTKMWFPLLHGEILNKEMHFISLFDYWILVIICVSLIQFLIPVKIFGSDYFNSEKEVSRTVFLHHPSSLHHEVNPTVDIS